MNYMRQGIPRSPSKNGLLGALWFPVQMRVELLEQIFTWSIYWG